MTVRSTEISILVINSTRKANDTDTFSIPLAKSVLTHGLISDGPFLRSVIETVISRVGGKAFYYLFLDDEYTLVKSVTLPSTLPKRDHNKLVFALLPKLFSLPLDEVAFDYQIIQRQLTIVVASKQIIISWQAFFSGCGLKLKAIGPANQGQSERNTVEHSSKQMLNPSILHFNLLPWRKQQIRVSLLINFFSLIIYISVTALVLIILWQSNNKQLTERIIRLERLKDEKRIKQKDSIKIGKLKQHVASMMENRKSNQRLDEHNKLLFDMFTALAASIPINLSLTGLAYQKDTLRVAGMSSEYSNLKKLVQTLRLLPFATDCQLTLVRKENNALFFELVIQL